MKIYYWNVRRLGSPQAVRRLQHMLKFHHPQIFFFMETKLNANRIEGVRRRYGFFNNVDVPAEGGDFNDILFGHEKQGDLPREEVRMEAFRRTLDDCQLVDIGFSGPWFTWERGLITDQNIKKRIDRRVATDGWLQLFPTYSLRHLPYSFSDHCHLLIETNEGELNRRHARFRRLNRRLKELNCEDRSEGSLAELVEVKLHLNMEMDKEVRYWEQRARVNWLKIGDKNTVFFHRYGSQRRRINRIRGLQRIDGSLATGGRTLKIFMNQRLLVPYTEEEIVEALKEIQPTKASGPDGFPAMFYQKYWNIIGKDTSEFCLNILNHGYSLEDINRTQIFVSVIYKIIAKTVANRLQEVLDHCIDAAQSAFVPGKLITDNVLLTYEVLHSFKNKKSRRKGFVALKLDMSKAYDRVEWPFIKGLSALMRLSSQERKICGAKVCRSSPTITHLIFADDCILFDEVLNRGINALKEILQEYEGLNVHCSTNMEKYLGLSNRVGRKKKRAFQNLKDRLKQKNNSWSITVISQEGREVFIKAVLQAIPTYKMACFLLSKSLCSDLENIMSSFWRQKGHGRKSMHWCDWKALSALKKESGMGFRNLFLFNIALLAKQG
ncbi:uncharacterized protein LOC108478000 [Gossypium arboreum]|uniref:uncharacterized protein LOC108478000 n=1 Tax=Gossypium arboreum TaxID=29729 RepID=UPI00081923BB|nr:uncharacterized protein LOC108478000 [Gossypium arboreum]